MDIKGGSLDPGPFLGRFTMIVGDVNTGKTFLTRRILEACTLEDLGRIAVVDLAPTIPQALLKGRGKGIGGALKVPQTGDVHYFHCHIHAPRLEGRDDGEVMELASQNALAIESLFEGAVKGKPDLLFVNDCSIYLHRGASQRLMGWILSAGTAVVNGYYGKALGGGPLSSREREGMDHLISFADRVIRLPAEGAFDNQGGTK